MGRIAAAGKTGKLSCDIAEYQSANVSVSEEKAGHDLLFGERNDGNEKTPLLGAGISAMALGVAAI
ncbi:MAG: hypothetical protein H5U18_06630, partial [Rhodobacteraceae bacterium]|nr:hypothetical protein [Paracoccaceae bacterium]